MRAEEMTVVDAAIALYHAIAAKSGVEESANALQRATEALIFSCPQCNTDRHTCPGCGTGIGHFEGACGQCMDDSTSIQYETPEESATIVDANLRAAGSSGLEERIVINASTYPCWECTEPDEDPRSWCDCGGRTDIYGPCAPPCCSRAHDPKDCPNNPDRGVDLAQEPVEPEPEWTSAEWQHVLAGDRVRLGAQEAEVTRSSVGTWHVDSSDRYRPRPWEHAEVSISLAHLDRPLVMTPGGPVEILADRDRAAILVLQKAFPLVTV